MNLFFIQHFWNRTQSNNFSQSITFWGICQCCLGFNQVKNIFEYITSYRARYQNRGILSGGSFECMFWKEFSNFLKKNKSKTYFYFRYRNFSRDGELRILIFSNYRIFIFFKFNKIIV
jgi:hypothetical protein